MFFMSTYYIHFVLYSALVSLLEYKTKIIHVFNHADFSIWSSQPIAAHRTACTHTYTREMSAAALPVLEEMSLEVHVCIMIIYIHIYVHIYIYKYI